MGTDSKKAPPLPAPTETDTATPTDLATDVSKPGDEKSSYSLPEDGTPVTIRTRGHKANRSQTSLLIEYFEGGKVPSAGAPERKPSVRVRLTPSKKAKGDHFQVTETKGSRKVSLTRRVPVEQLSSRDLELPEGEDAHSMTSYASATEESNVSRNPLDIDIERSHRRRRPASPLIPSDERIAYQPGNPSEISAIPTDSFLDGTGPTSDVKRSGKGDALAGAAAGAAAGFAASEALQNSKVRGNARERAKISDKSDRSKDRSDKKRRSSKSRTSSLSEHTGDENRSPRRRSSRTHQESNVSGPDSSMLSSNLSAGNKSVDARSMRSGTSRSSINNPKLLETVEDAIRRLILPELTALKREQSKREGRRSSITSTGTSVSKEDIYSDRRRSSGQKGDLSKDSPRTRERRNREARHDYENMSVHSRESLEPEYRTRDDDYASPSRGGNLLKSAAAGAVGAAAVKGLSSALEDNSESFDRKHRDRRRRRIDHSRSRSLGRDQYADDYEEEPAPPMPLMSDINPSEVTRTSILSADTDRPHSAADEIAPTRELRGHAVSARSTPTPSNLPPVDLPLLLSTQHANVSHGDLTALPRGKNEYAEEYETDEYGRKIPMGQYDYYEGQAPRDLPEYDQYPEDPYGNSYYNTQDVPPPLKYVPYEAGARGLSPIQSVSGYTEGGSEAPQPRHSRSMQSVDAFSSPDKSPEHARQTRSVQSFDSLQLSPDNRRSFATMEPAGAPQTAAGQEVRGIGVSPNIIHTPFGVESAVASLVDGSMLDQSVVTGASGYDHGGGVRDSTISYDSQAHSRGVSASPDKMSLDSPREMDESRLTPGDRSLAPSQEYMEYEIDDNGRKVPRAKYRHSPTASEAAITAGAVGAAAAALRAAKERNQTSGNDYADENFQPAGVFRNRSFKERAMGWQPKSTPTHSMDRLDYDDPPTMVASGMPDLDDPMPEIGYVDDELETNPSVVNERLDGTREMPNWTTTSGRATPTQRSIGGQDEEVTPKRGLGLAEAAGAAALGTAAAMAAMPHEHEHEQDEWRRTSDERKRDTLITNPYEDTSPVANPTLDDNILDKGGINAAYNTPYGTASPGFGHKYDEGYMSNGPNRTPDMNARGKSVDFAGALEQADDDDPFVSKANPRHLSGMSQGMASPFYDAATGAGIDRIENKDIVALMQHLMVRDAQRSARDTEIVALLMNAALEMRNSFREMKDMVQDTGDDVIFANVENTEKLQKAINGPRPYPGAASRSIQSASQAGTLDEAVKRKNLWKRALQGLSAKGTNDLSRIEDMLVQLLGEVDVLKSQTAPGLSTGEPGQSLENLQPEGQFEQDKGYEPEGASTASQPSQARAQPQPRMSDRKFSDHRISTVPEHDEEYQYDVASPATERYKAGLLSPDYAAQIQRGGSVPLDTPPQAPSVTQPVAISADNTPRSEKGKKHKSSSSSGWLPKISRWSETTASSVGRAFRGSGTPKKSKNDEYQPPSRSGSSLASYEEHYRQHDPFGDDKLHTGFSDPNLIPENRATTSAQPRPTSYAPSEDPKYKAHRNSVNLQHPQPRPGQTERFRTALEYSAQEYDTPMTPRSTDWAGSATSLSRLPPNTNRYSASSAREPDYALSSPRQQSGAPPRPPKEPIEAASEHTPVRGTRVSSLQKNSPQAHASYESGYGSASGTHASQFTDGSPKVANRNLSAALGVPNRRPSGPRAMTPKSPEEEAAREERRRKRDTFGTIESQDTDTF